MSLSQTLWKENEDLAQAALEHRFVRGIGDGSPLFWSAVCSSRTPP